MFSRNFKYFVQYKYILFYKLQSGNFIKILSVTKEKEGFLMSLRSFRPQDGPPKTFMITKDKTQCTLHTKGRYCP